MTDAERLSALEKAVLALREQVGQPKRYLNRDEVALYLDSTPNTIAAWTSKRKIPHIKSGGRRCLYDRKAIDIWLAEQAVPVE